MTDPIFWIGGTRPSDTALIGGKGHGLDQLTRAGLQVPEAFVVTTAAFRDAVTGTLGTQIERRIAASTGETDLAALDAATASIRDLIVEATDGHRHERAIRDAYEQLQERLGVEHPAVAVRSSSAAEDSAEHSFAGEHDSYLWVLGPDEVAMRVRQCWASLFTLRAVTYRASAGGGSADTDAMAVVVQRMVPARAAGVLMTLNPANGDRSKVVIESLWGLGEPLVSGAATPDRFLVDKITREIISRDLADKPSRLVHDMASGRGTVEEPVAEDRRTAPSLTDEQILALVDIGRAVEQREGRPQDAEFAVVDGDGGAEDVYLLQARPETVWSNRAVRRVTAGGTGSALSHVVATLTGSSN